MSAHPLPGRTGVLLLAGEGLQLCCGAFRNLKDPIMGFHVQPLPIEIPADDPFRNDLLDRREPAEVLRHLLTSLRGPCVLAVDAAWGDGKTTFLDMWSQHLRNEGFSVIGFNAWKTDFSDDPFIALSSELTEGLDQLALGGSLANMVADTKAVAGKVVRQVVPAAIRAATSGVLDIDRLLKAEGRLSAYRKAKGSLDDFNTALRDMADALLEAGNGLPLVIMIDELDRCRPSYAVELLEVAKHLFAVNGIVFVLAINRTQLSHSVKALYGNDFDANEYLKRFIGIDFQLPLPDRSKFISAALEQVDISKYFERTMDRESRQNYSLVRDMLTLFFGIRKFNLRQVAQATRRIGLVLASLASNERTFALGAVVALVLRTLDDELYREFTLGQKSDLEVVDSLLSNVGEDWLLGKHDRMLFEAIIIVGYLEILGADVSWPQSFDSPLLNRYREATTAEVPNGGTEDKYLQHAIGVTGLIQRMSMGFLQGGVGFKHSVRRIELLSPGLMGDPPAQG